MRQATQEHDQRAARIEELLEEVAAFPDSQARATTEELIQTLLDLYGDGLARILDLTVQSDMSGQALIELFAGDELVRSLMLLHGLHPAGIDERVAQALDEVRPYLMSHGGDVELIGVDGGVAHLRLEGSCHGCPSSTLTLKMAIEEAIYKAAPDLDELQVEGVVEPPHPLTLMPRKSGSRAAQTSDHEGQWKRVEGLGKLGSGVLKAIMLQKVSLVFCQVEGSFYAYHNRCAGCGATLAKGRLEGAILTCATCNRQYDVCRAGRSVDDTDSDQFLSPIPLLMEGNEVKVIVPSLAKASRVGVPLPMLQVR